MSFNDENKQRIRDAHGIEILTKIVDDPLTDAPLLQNAIGTLRMLGIKLVSPISASTDSFIPASESKLEVNQMTPQEEEEEQKLITGHIMISYNWGVQPLVLKLAASLKAAGYPVWLDVEQMKGSTLDASMHLSAHFPIHP